MRGRPSQLKVAIDEATRATLEGWLRRQKLAAGLARRARAMLLLADGQPYTHTAAQVGLAERHVRKWAKRFVAHGLDGLHDRPRPGRRPVFPPGSGPARGQDGL
jgi:Helix-turn-helix domain